MSLVVEHRTAERSATQRISARWRDYGQLVKMRLTFLVVFSTLMGYLAAAGFDAQGWPLTALLVGGFLTVGSANCINQIIERHTDRLMRRTENRPLAQDRMPLGEATVLALISGLAGVFILGHFLNPLSGLLSLVSLLLYAFAYTPMKKVSPIAVYIGAIPGALPPLIGYVAFTGSVDGLGLTIFLLQFIWQFPHFWAIAWLLDDDYRRAGYKLLPLRTGKNKASAVSIVLSTALLLPLTLYAGMTDILGWGTVSLLMLANLAFLGQSIRLLQKMEDASAKSLMFGSFAYLPIIQMILVFNQLI